jgi:hypothetical protein
MGSPGFSAAASPAGAGVFAAAGAPARANAKTAHPASKAILPLRQVRREIARVVSVMCPSSLMRTVPTQPHGTSTPTLLT